MDIKQFQEKIKKYLKYDAETGNLIRRISVGRGGRWKAGTIVGTKDKDGYLCTHFDHKFYKVHHLVWIYHHGEKPKMIDHINRCPSDNRIENLRIADKRKNSINTRLQSNNTSGYRGISWSKQHNKWEVYIHHYGKKYNLGIYPDIEDAKAARILAEKESKDYVEYGCA